MTRILRWAALGFICLGLEAEGRPVKVAVFPFVPGISMGPDREAQGFFVDMLRDVAQREGWELSFVPGTWSEGLERARRGEVDLLTSVAYTPERAQFLDFGREPAFTVWSILYAHPKVQIQSVLDVRGLRIGLMRDDMNGIHFRELCRKFNIQATYVEFGTFPEVLAAVSAHEVDAGVTVSTFGYAREQDYRVVRTPVVFNPFDISFATARGRNPDLLPALDRYLREGKADPTHGYRRALDRWMHPQVSKGLPAWALWTGGAALGLLGLAAALVALLRHQVRRATRKIRTLNEDLRSELALRRRREERLVDAASGVSAATGETFFQNLVAYLARATGADIALVGELQQPAQGQQELRTLAIFRDGRAAENLAYNHRDTPCGQALRGELCLYPSGVQALFPRDQMLVDLEAQSYVGAPLTDSQGRVLGNLAVLHRQPLIDGEETASLLRIFSARAAAELERRHEEVERKLLEQQVQHAQKLESLGVLAGGIAHDFNNLLTAMLGHLNVAQARMAPEHPAQSNLESVEKIILRAADLTRQMLAYSGKGRFVVRTHDLNAVIREMAHLLEVSIPKKIELVFDLSTPLPGMEADGAQIQQVVMNLVTNAADAIGESEGTIRLATRAMHLERSDLDQLYQGQPLAPGPYALLEVSDTGCGMSPEVQTRIFDPFFTTKATGRGLGLSATLGILKGHRAGLAITSQPGRGTTFRLLFPACSHPAAPVEAVPVTSESFTGASVLLVDDEAIIREAGAELLRILGCTVHLAEDGFQALETIRQGLPLDLVLMDLTMPHMDGREAFLALRGLRPTLPVLLSSGYSEPDSVKELLTHDLAGFLQKPYTLEALRKALGEALGAARGI